MKNSTCLAHPEKDELNSDFCSVHLEEDELNSNFASCYAEHDFSNNSIEDAQSASRKSPFVVFKPTHIDRESVTKHRNILTHKFALVINYFLRCLIYFLRFIIIYFLRCIISFFVRHLQRFVWRKKPVVPQEEPHDNKKPGKTKIDTLELNDLVVLYALGELDPDMAFTVEMELIKRPELIATVRKIQAMDDAFSAAFSQPSTLTEIDYNDGFIKGAIETTPAATGPISACAAPAEQDIILMIDPFPAVISIPSDSCRPQRPKSIVATIETLVLFTLASTLLVMFTSKLHLFTQNVPVQTPIVSKVLNQSLVAQNNNDASLLAPKVDKSADDPQNHSEILLTSCKTDNNCTTLTIKDIGFSFQRFPSGTFSMGTADFEGECHYDFEMQRQVSLSKGFWPMETEISEKQWDAFMGNNYSSLQGKDAMSVLLKGVSLENRKEIGIEVAKFFILLNNPDTAKSQDFKDILAAWSKLKTISDCKKIQLFIRIINKVAEMIQNNEQSATN